MSLRVGWVAAAVSSVALNLYAQVMPLESVVVTAARVPQMVADVPFSTTTLVGDALRAAPAITIDDALRGVPGFSLFRRGDSFSTNPTAQGVSLRGLGPSGASRTLVLLDGVPLNDSFGGWVLWSKVPREALSRVELVRGGGGTAWGNSALGGVIHLLTEPATGERTRFSTTWGDFSTRSAEVELTQPIGKGTWQLLGDAFATTGYRLVAGERRGSIDRAAGSNHSWLTGRLREPIGDDLQVTFTGRIFREKRGNGTPYQQNSTREIFASVDLETPGTKPFSWKTTLYVQDESFASTFSSVNASRTAETPASNQFAVPALARGLAWTGAWTHPDGARTTAGIDGRLVHGETREYFTFSAGDFTRLRAAGGAQTIAGIFVMHERILLPDIRGSAGLRLDDWRETDGHLRESDRASGSVSRNDIFATADGLEFSPSLGLTGRVGDSLHWRLAGQRAFRRPTLNELYRPFRVGNIITVPNPALVTEAVTTGEMGLDYASGAVTAGVTGFWHDLHHAVGNVTVARGPITLPEFGFIPAGGVGRKRLNLDRTRVRGVELSTQWRATSSLDLEASFLFDDAKVRRASVNPALEGKRLAEVPRHTASFGATWRPTAALTIAPRIRWMSRQFDDDENTLLLGEVVIPDLSLRYALNLRSEIYITIENFSNARIETGRSLDGVVNIGAPRFAFGGVRCHW